MAPYRKYLLSGAAVPRKTAYRRRKRNEALQNDNNRSAAAAHFAPNVRDNAQVTNDVVVNSPEIIQDCSNDQQILTDNVHNASDQEILTDNVPNAELVSVVASPEDSSINQQNTNSISQEQEEVNAAGSFPISQSNDETDNIFQEEEIEADFSEDESEHAEVKQNNPQQNQASFLSDSKKLCENLCACLDFTVGDIVFMILSLGYKHNLAWNVQIDILKMMHTIYQKISIPTNKFSYFQNLGTDSADITFHVFCSMCESYIGAREDVKDVRQCPRCAYITDTSDLLNQFLSLSIESQLRNLFQDPYFASLVVKHRFNRIKDSDDALEDIYDGSEYQKHFKNGGLLSSCFNLSLSFFVDGISTGKSTGKTMWPIYAQVNELPHKDRSKYTLLVGLYIGSKDPNQETFLKPFVTEMSKLSTDGFNWEYQNKSVNSKVIPLCAVADSVARWQILNFQSFHAYFGCTYCYQKQVTLGPRKRRFNVLDKAEERTPESTFQDAVEAFRRKDESRKDARHYRGVKGPSVLMGLQFFSLIWGCVIDYMHAICLGVIKTHMDYLFDSTRKRFWIDMQDDYVGIEHLFKAIDARLLTLKPPSGITRTPRSISSYKLWKASEWRTWLLFYAIPCLKGLLKDKHLENLALLSEATSIVLQKSVKIEQLKKAHHYFLMYCQYFEKQFNPQHTIYNIHLLTHVCKCVLKWGPVWTHSAFPYEGENRYLLQLYKSPSNVLLQIARKFLVYSSLHSKCNELVSTEDALLFSEKVLNKQLCRFLRSGSCILSGKGKTLDLAEQEKQYLFQQTGVSSSDCKFFHRVIFNGMRFTTGDYSVGKKNDDSFVVLKNGKFSTIKYITLLPSLEVIFLGEKVQLEKDPLISNGLVVYNHVKQVKKINTKLCAFVAADISGQCTTMTVGGVIYISRMPYGCYGD